MHLIDNISHTPDDCVFLISEYTQSSYGELKQEISVYLELLRISDLKKSDFIVILGDFNLTTVAAIIATLDFGLNFTIQTEKSIKSIKHEIMKTGCTHFLQERKISKIENSFPNMLQEFQASIIFFTSGSTGFPKAIVHNANSLLDKFSNKKIKSYKTIAFLTFDHMGGFNTLLSVLFSQSTIIYSQDRNPKHICQLISQYKVTLFSTTPSFLSLLLSSGYTEKYDFASLEKITYGTEAMNELVLKKLIAKFPWISFKQTYGLTEVGVLPTKSKSSDSLFFKIDSPLVKTKILDGILYIKTASNLNGKIVFDTDQNPAFVKHNLEWFCTDDVVEEEDGYIKIIGRKTDIINVAGEKIYPSEIENKILQIGYVKEVLAFKKKHLLLGNVVSIKVVLDQNSFVSDLSPLELKKIIQSDCKNLLPNFAIPVYVETLDRLPTSQRLKALRP